MKVQVLVGAVAQGEGFADFEVYEVCGPALARHHPVTESLHPSLGPDTSDLSRNTSHTSKVPHPQKYTPEYISKASPKESLCTFHEFYETCGLV